MPAVYHRRSLRVRLPDNPRDLWLIARGWRKFLNVEAKCRAEARRDNAFDAQECCITVRGNFRLTGTVPRVYDD
jgi:hypothetical protein